MALEANELRSEVLIHNQLIQNFFTFVELGIPLNISILLTHDSLSLVEKRASIRPH
jgi:hypothetical protein